MAEKEILMKTQVKALCEYLKAAGLKAAVWQDRRVYINKDRTAKIYFQFDDPARTDWTNPLAGAALRVFSNCYSQSEKWNKNRANELRKQVIECVQEDEELGAFYHEIANEQK
jgi:hypothetical protein